MSTLDGRVLKRLERYGKHRRPVGELELTDQRVAWSVRRGIRARGPGSVRTVGL